MSDPQQPPAQPHGVPPQQQPAQYPAQQHPAQQHPAQHPAQAQGHAQHPAQQQQSPYYAAPQYPAAPSAAGSASTRSAASAGTGRLAFVLALVSLGLGLITTVSYPLIFRWFYDSVAIGAFGVISNGLIFVVALAGLLLGVVAVRRPGSKLLPGIAIGITASQLAGILVSWVSNLFYGLPF
nr:hypothetical protein [Microbacterium hydrocarbonoxydans]